MNNLKVEKALVVLNDNDVNVIKSASNLATVKTAQTNEINVYEKMFEGTKVASVNTMNLDGKNKRRGMVVGKTAKTKKAIVTLTADSKDIEIFAGL